VPLGPNDSFLNERPKRPLDLIVGCMLVRVPVGRIQHLLSSIKSMWHAIRVNRYHRRR